MENFGKTFLNFIKSSNERIALQRFYLTAAVAGFISGSFLNIFEDKYGRLLLFLSLASIAIFVTNAIAWALGKSLAENLIKADKKSKK